MLNKNDVDKLSLLKKRLNIKKDDLLAEINPKIYIYAPTYYKKTFITGKIEGIKLALSYIHTILENDKLCDEKEMMMTNVE